VTLLEPEFSRTVRVDQIPVSGIRLELKAKPTELAALAKRFAIQSIDDLTANVTLKAMAGGSLIRMDGHLNAQVVQTCVVTLDPVSQTVDEDFSLTFGGAADDIAGGEIELSLDDEDPPDPIIDGTIDVGEVVAEHLALALDPFPRKPGISFDGGDGNDVEAEKKTSPFAVLAQLRKNKG
jgi:uncharacterized metal-binding protein YceD (DUF177 family)